MFGIVGIVYGSAIGDAIGLGSEYMTCEEVQFSYPELCELIQLESSSITGESNVFSDQVASEVVELTSGDESQSEKKHQIMNYITFESFVRDRHRSSSRLLFMILLVRWQPGDWSEKTDIAILLLVSIIHVHSSLVSSIEWCI